MLVEDRLRQGLEANATSFTPSGEGRLETLHRRRRRRTVNTAASLGAAAAALVAGVVVQLGGLSFPGQSPDQDPARPGVIEPSGRPTALPELGGFVHEVTRKQGLALGVPRHTVDELAGKDGVLLLGIQFRHGNFTIWTNDDRYKSTAWDFGSYEFTSARHLVLTTISDKCPSCTTTLTWRWAGRTGQDVVFSSVDRDTDGDLARWFWEGRWTYQAPR